MSGFGTIHSLETPIEYHIVLMGTCVHPIENRKQGLSVHILQRGNEYLAIDPRDEANLKSYMSFDGTQIVGWGMLVERVWVDEWFVAWRPFSPAPKAIEWNDK